MERKEGWCTRNTTVVYNPIKMLINTIYRTGFSNVDTKKQVFGRSRSETGILARVEVPFPKIR